MAAVALPQGRVREKQEQHAQERRATQYQCHQIIDPSAEVSDSTATCSPMQSDRIGQPPPAEGSVATDFSFPEELLQSTAPIRRIDAGLQAAVIMELPIAAGHAGTDLPQRGARQILLPRGSEHWRMPGQGVAPHLLKHPRRALKSAGP